MLYDNLEFYDSLEVGEENVGIVSIIIDCAEEQKVSNKKSIYASQSLCARKESLALQSGESIFDSNITVSLAAQIGNATEKVILDILEKSGIVIERQARLTESITPYRFGGIVDAIVMYPNNNTPCVIDVKTTGKVYNKSKRIWHERQIQVYCALLGLQNGRIIRVARNLYDMNGPTIYELEVDTHKKILLKALANYYYAYVCYEHEIVPVNYGMKKSYCTYCRLFDSCWNTSKFSSICDENDECLEIAKQYAQDVYGNGEIKKHG